MAYATTGDGNWSAAGTWVGGSIPPEPIDDAVTIGHDVALDVDRTTGDVTVTVNAGDTLTVNAAKTLTVAAGTLSVSGTVDVAGALSCTSGHVSIANGGEVHVQAGGTYANTNYLTVAAGGVLDADAAITIGGTPTIDGDLECAASLTYDGGGSPSGTGTVTFDAAAGNPTLACNGQRLPAVVVDNNGAASFALADAARVASLTQTAAGSVFDDDGNTLDAAGDILCTDGTTASAAMWTMSGDGNLGEDSYANRLYGLTVAAGVTATATATVWIRRLAGAGTVDVNGQTVTVECFASGADWWTFTGTVAGAVTIYNATAGCTAPLVVSGALTLDTTSARAFSLAARIECGGKLLLDGGSEDGYTIDCAGHSVRCSELVLGPEGAVDGFGAMDLAGGVHVIGAGGIHRGNAANVGDALNLGSCALELAGTLDATGITCTADAAGVVHVIGGTITDTDGQLDTQIHAHNTAHGGNNANVSFDAYAHPAWAGGCA